MNTKNKIRIGIISGTVLAALAITGIAFADDSAAWTTLNVSGKLSDSLKLELEESFRFSDVGDPSLARQHTDLSASWSANDRFTAVGGYRNTSLGEHRLYIGVDVALFSLGKIDFGNETRLDLRDWDTPRGRSKVSVATEVAGLSPYVTDEVFVGEDGFLENRATVGVSKSLNEMFSVGAYYMLATALVDEAAHTHVMGLDFGVSL